MKTPTFKLLPILVVAIFLSIPAAVSGQEYDTSLIIRTDFNNRAFRGLQRFVVVYQDGKAIEKVEIERDQNMSERYEAVVAVVHKYERMGYRIISHAEIPVVQDNVLLMHSSFILQKT
jgi:hypothetical protein